MSEPLEASESSEPNQPALTSRAVEGVRREPAKSMTGAFFAGLILSLFPVGRIIAAITGLALILLRPFLIFLGLLKVVEEVGKRQKR